MDANPNIPQKKYKSFTLNHGDVKTVLPQRFKDSNKGTYGKTLIISGQKGMAGACFFSGKAAYLAGTGLVQIFTAEENREIIQIKLPEAVIIPPESDFLEKAMADADSILIGPGLGQNEYAKDLLKKVLSESKVPVIIDADGLNILSENMDILDEITIPVILTPHLMELSRLIKKPLSEIKGHEIEIANNFIERYNVILVMKSSTTYIISRGKSAAINTTGDSSLSKGGTGDCLAGFIAGLCAESKDPYKAAIIGPYIHGLAGSLAGKDLTTYSVLASDVLNYIPKAIKEILSC